MEVVIYYILLNFKPQSPFSVLLIMILLIPPSVIGH